MVINRSVEIQTSGNCDMIDITTQIASEIGSSGITNGIATVFVSGSTAAVTTIEYEGGLINDFKDVWDRNVPQSIPYQHDKRWGDGNGHSHIRASLLGSSFVVPFVNRKMTIGTWQQIIIVDFDNRPRSRSIIIQIMGE